MIDYLTLQSLALHDPTRGTVWRGMGEGHVRFECARCALQYVDDVEFCRIPADVAVILSATELLPSSPDPTGYYCYSCTVSLT